MNNMSKGLAASLVRGVCVALTLIITASSPSVSAAGGKKGGGSGGGGGGGGGGSTKVAEARVTGYVTAIDYTARTLTIGASYYGSGNLKVDSSTKISFNNVNCAFEDLTLGTWVEARYDFTTRIATKLSATGGSSS